MAHLSPFPKFRATTPQGDPLVGGKVYSYAAGTSTPQATYLDKSEVSPNTNPIILDANGEADVWLKDSLSYKIVLAGADDVILWTVDNIQHINDGSITLGMIADGFLSNDAAGHAKMADGYLSTNTAGRAKMQDGFLSADITGRGKMADGFVNTAKLLDGVLSADAAGHAKMADGFLTADAAGRAKMADGFVTQAKRATLGLQTSTGCGLFTTSSSTAVDVTNLTVTITTTGRPVFIGLIADGNADSAVEFDGGPSATGNASFQFLRAATVIAKFNIKGNVGGGPPPSTTMGHPPSAFSFVETPSAGTYTYKFQAFSLFSTTVRVNYAKLIAYEL